MRGTRAFVPMLKAQGSGRIVNTASLAGLVHPPGMGSYNAVKAAVVAFSETAAHELAPYGVGVTAVCPSYFKTNLMSSMRGGDADLAAQIARSIEQSPITADDIAAAVLEGIDRGDELVVPDEPARAAYSLKLSDRTGLRRADARRRPRGRRSETHERSDRLDDPRTASTSATRTPSTSPRWPPGCASTATTCPRATPAVRQFPGGASNLTYLLAYDDRELILRRPPAGVKAKSAHDMRREFTHPVEAGAGVRPGAGRWSRSATTRT